ncbi:MAG: hypothetical protein GC204_09315 [Chloroflexi bacterium]|nr:hypothetical protein [Chloroflexota bacterium]
MTLVIGPEIMRTCETPCVGIFWRVAQTLLVDRSTLNSAESYGDCLTHPGGHYERWEEWRKIGGLRLSQLGYPAAICSSEYDEWPRGRIVYEVPAGRFVVYADRRLQPAQTMALILQAFGLQASPWRMMSDAHYQ